MALSADVDVAMQANFKEVHEPQNSARFGHGIVICKYGGARGKGGANDASAEFTGKVRNLFNKIGWHFKRGIFAAAPPIGHSNAFTFPDRPYLNWKYTDYLGELTLVTNNIKFVIGFLDLYESLIGPYAKKQDKSPRLGDTHDRTNDELRQKLWEGVNFHGSLKKRCRNWQAIILKFAKEQGLTIPDNHLHYDEKEWENNVYKSIDVKKKKLKVSIEEFEKSPLYRFHEAGRAHRVFVLSIVNDPSALGVRALEGEVMISNEIIHKTREKKLLKKI